MWQLHVNIANEVYASGKGDSLTEFIFTSVTSQAPHLYVVGGNKWWRQIPKASWFKRPFKDLVTNVLWLHSHSSVEKPDFSSFSVLHPTAPEWMDLLLTFILTLSSILSIPAALRRQPLGHIWPTGPLGHLWKRLAFNAASKSLVSPNTAGASWHRTRWPRDFHIYNTFIFGILHGYFQSKLRPFPGAIHDISLSGRT